MSNFGQKQPILRLAYTLIVQLAILTFYWFLLCNLCIFINRLTYILAVIKFPGLMIKWVYSVKLIVIFYVFSGIFSLILVVLCKLQFYQLKYYNYWKKIWSTNNYNFASIIEINITIILPTSSCVWSLVLAY